MGLERSTDGSCPACGTALTGRARCPSCGAAAGLLSLELPSSSAAVEPPAAEGAPAIRGAQSRVKATRRIPSSHAPAPQHQRAVLVALPRSERLELPRNCACCDSDKADAFVVETRTGIAQGVSQTYAISVPYCQPCRRHLRRPGLRTALFLLALPALFYLGWRLHPVRPENVLQGAGLCLAILIAARALSYVLVPRLSLGVRHGREKRPLWIHGFDSNHITLAVCNAGYRMRLEGNAAPRPLFEFWRKLSRLLYGGERPLIPLLRPLLTLALAVAAVTQFKPLPEEERAYLAFIASPSRSRAVGFAQSFPRSTRLPEIEDYLWESTVASPSKDAHQAYLRAFPKGRYRSEAKSALADAEVDALLARLNRAAAIKFVVDNPNSPRLSEVRTALFNDLMVSAAPSELAPPVSLLRRLWTSCPTGKVPTRIEGFNDKDYRQAIESKLKQALRTAGLDLTLVNGDAMIEVDGEDGLNRNFSYSKFSFASSGPYGEFVRATVSLRFGNGEPAWTGSMSAKSPSSVSYTTYRIGSGSPIDTGPSQHDVHSQTIPLWEQALDPLFRYGP